MYTLVDIYRNTHCLWHTYVWERQYGMW